ncbi:MAG TPA: polymer-forming cytoskeletal protein [Bacteroidota bacterium]|nr:polymer-forming cytoskeletal protein [Bacteroidota bacterium]
MADKQTPGELSLVGTGTVVEGKIKTEGSIRIDGKLVGELHAKANIAIGLGGVVEGNLSGKNVSLAGKVVGTVAAAEKLVLEQKCTVKGDIRAARLVVDEGATFDGQCAMTPASSTAKPDGKRDT